MNTKGITMRLLLFIFLTISALAGNSQISVVDVPESEDIGQIGAMGEVFIKIYRTGNSYTFYYQDQKYKRIKEYKSFTFNNENGDYEVLYNMILDGLKNPPKEDIMLELPNDFVWINFEKLMGVPVVRFIHSVEKNGGIMGATIQMNKKKVQKLFAMK